MDVTEEPPFENTPDHLDPTEVHKLDDRLWREHSPAGPNRDAIRSSLLETIRANGTRRTLLQFHTHLLLRNKLLEHVEQTRDDADPDELDISREQDPGLPPRLVDFGVGITLRTNTETTDRQSFEQIARHLLALKNWYGRNGGWNHSVDSPLANPYYSMVFRELTTFRHADSHQLLEKGYRAYKQWEEFMEATLGFSIEDAVFYTVNLAENINPRLVDQQAEVAKWSPSLLNFSQRAIDLTAEAVLISEETLLDWLDESTRCEAFLNRMSITPGSVEEFETPVDVNPLEKTPLIRIDRGYLPPLPRNLQYAIGNTFYYDLIDSELSGEFQLQWGEWLEEWTVNCLKTQFSQSEIIRNYTYEYDGEDVEGDILILHDEKAIVIECKGKTLSAETRKGNFGGIEALSNELQQGIGKAYHQADRLVNGVQSGRIAKIETEDDDTIDLEPSQFDTVCRWLVLGESYGSIATRDFAKILDMSPIPYVCDIFDLQILTEVLETPGQLLHYVTRRTHQTTEQLRRPHTPYTNSKIYSPDEIDYMGVYDRNNGKFPVGAKNILGAGDNLRSETISSLLEREEFRFKI